ncbi:MAG: HPF/RaiA family ribosome-associated protein [Azonexus sp.]|nr:HPF/RaiA family ribosome-associated protein [Azonexus sp.]
MQIHVYVKGMVSASKLRTVASERLSNTLSRFSHIVQDVTIRMHDINGPDRGGVDKLCRVVLRLKGNSFVVIEELGVNMTEAINRVVDRLHHSVSKQLSRLVKVDRSSIRQNSLTAEMA